MLIAVAVADAAIHARRAAPAGTQDPVPSEPALTPASAPAASGGQAGAGKNGRGVPLAA
jgi:hypothetical protein